FKKICLNGVAGAGGELHCSKLAGSVRRYAEVGAARNSAEIGIIGDVESAVLSPVETSFVDAQGKSPSEVVRLNADRSVVANNKGRRNERIATVGSRTRAAVSGHDDRSRGDATIGGELEDGGGIHAIEASLLDPAADLVHRALRDYLT